jgi:hypothetical protein
MTPSKSHRRVSTAASNGLAQRAYATALASAENEGLRVPPDRDISLSNTHHAMRHAIWQVLAIGLQNRSQQRGPNVISLTA